jgi:cytochrome c oxidase subunit 3
MALAAQGGVGVMATNKTSASTVTPYATGAGSTGWWATLFLVVIEAVVFAGLVSSYFYYFSNATAWPPQGIEPPDLLIPTVSSIILIASAIPAYAGDHALANGDIDRLKLWQAIATIMLIVVLAMRGYEYSRLEYRWDDTVYGSIVWIMTGIHSTHVLVVLIRTLSEQVLAWKGFFNERRRSAVQGTTLYWVFGAAVWVPLYATLYLFPNFG